MININFLHEYLFLHIDSLTADTIENELFVFTGNRYDAPRDQAIYV